MGDDSFEDFEQFWFGDFSVIVLVDGCDELVDFLLGDLSALPHVFQGVVDQLGDLVRLQSPASVLVISVENCVHCVSQVVI